MTLNAVFTKPVTIHSDTLEWQASPMAGVDRRMLDRIGNEIARATTIVRYAKGSHFSPHTHTGGEEFIVLDGTFQDEHGDYPTGTYVRNPPTSSHTPSSADGCVIFVKLWQFDMNDRTSIRVDMTKTLKPTDAGVQQSILHEDAHEKVTFNVLAPKTQTSIEMKGGAEILVLDGSLISNDETLPKNSWQRLPTGSDVVVISGSMGASFWMKTGHIPHAKAPAV